MLSPSRRGKITIRGTALAALGRVLPQPIPRGGGAPCLFVAIAARQPRLVSDAPLVERLLPHRSEAHRVFPALRRRGSVRSDPVEPLPSYVDRFSF